MIRLAINGYGRIGRCVLRSLYESGRRDRMRVVAINEPADCATIAHLTKYDTTHGRFPHAVSAEGDVLTIAGDDIVVSHHESIDAINWADHQIDLVLECSGRYTSKAQLHQHLTAGASRVLLSQPGEAGIPAIVYGINQQLLSNTDAIVSSASCTTNCIVPVITVLDSAFTIQSGIITTIHSAMNDQPVLDAYHHTNLRKTRAAGQSIIPVDTALAMGVGRILPGMENRFSAHALRVPTTNVSAMELTLMVEEKASVEAVNDQLQAAACGELMDILGYTDEPLASCDFNHDSRSGIVDAGQTRVSGQLINVLVWFDNEWGYANRMLDVAEAWTA